MNEHELGAAMVEALTQPFTVQDVRDMIGDSINTLDAQGDVERYANAIGYLRMALSKLGDE